MVKRAGVGKKYRTILFFIVIIAIGFIVYLNKQFIVNIPTDDLMGPTANKTEARVVFDVYEMKTEDNGYKWQDAIVVPRIIDGGNTLSENTFSEYVFNKIAGNNPSDTKDGYIKINESSSVSEVNNAIDQLVTDNNIEANGINGDSQTYIREYMLKNNIFSGLLYFYSTGGAHPIDSPVVVNYDLLNKKEVTLNDILSISEDSLINYLNAEQNKLYPVVLGEPENLNCSREELAPSGFYMTENKLVIITSPGRLNSYCSPSFEFEYSAIKGIIKKDGLLMRIITQ